MCEDAAPSAMVWTKNISLSMWKGRLSLWQSERADARSTFRLFSADVKPKTSRVMKAPQTHCLVNWHLPLGSMSWITRYDLGSMHEFNPWFNSMVHGCTCFVAASSGPWNLSDFDCDKWLTICVSKCLRTWRIGFWKQCHQSECAFFTSAYNNSDDEMCEKVEFES